MSEQDMYRRLVEQFGSGDFSNAHRVKPIIMSAGRTYDQFKHDVQMAQAREGERIPGALSCR